MPIKAQASTLSALLCALVLCAVVYYPGLHGDFIFDDGPNIVQNSRLQVGDASIGAVWQAALSSDSGTLKRPISMLSFWANYHTAGLNPFYFKITNLVIHMLNGLALFWLTRLLLSESLLRASALTESRRDWIALAVATIWLVHPLNLTSVLYIVQRMASLSTMFTLLGLICYVHGRIRLARGAPGLSLILLGLLGCGSLAILSKENGVLLPLYMAVIEATLFQFAGLSPVAARKLKLFFVVTVAIPGLAATLFVLTNPEWLAGQYQGRDFSVSERLLSEARILWFYLKLAVAPTPGSLGLFHDDFAVSRGLYSPWTTLPSVIGIVGSFVAALLLRKRAPLFAFAALWFLGGHILESSIIGLELVHEHRNYLPIYGPMFAGVYGLGHVASRLGSQTRIAIPLALVAALAAVTYGRSNDWSNLNNLRMALVRHHPDSAISNYEAGLALAAVAQRNPELAPGYYDAIKSCFERSASLDKTAINGLFGLILLNATNGRPIDDESVDRLEQRLSSIPLNFTVVGAFRSLLGWTQNHTIDLPRDRVVSLFEAALGNRTATRSTKATLLSILSSYYYNVLGEQQEAVSLAMAATNEDPSAPVHHLSLADLALKLGNLQLASRELDAVDRLDPLHRFAVQSRDLDGTLKLAADEVRN
jgi:tetratricopeptide (TPR) repeat protein